MSCYPDGMSRLDLQHVGEIDWDDEGFQEIDFAQWHDDRALQERYPFEDTLCDWCETVIGGHLKGDQSVFVSIFVTPSDEAICESCTDQRP